MNNLKYTLVALSTTISDGLYIPDLPVPNWLNVTIGLLISIKSIRGTSALSSRISTPLSHDIINFISKWVSLSQRIKLSKRTPELLQLLNSKFKIPPDVPIDVNEQLSFILHMFLLPIIDRCIPAIKTHCCTSCNFTVHTRFSISYIPINIVEEQSQFRHRLNIYFDGCISDHVCDKCSMSMSRHIKLLECKMINKFFSTNKVDLIIVSRPIGNNSSY